MHHYSILNAFLDFYNLIIQVNFLHQDSCTEEEIFMNLLFIILFLNLILNYMVFFQRIINKLIFQNSTNLFVYYILY